MGLINKEATLSSYIMQALKPVHLQDRSTAAGSGSSGSSSLSSYYTAKAASISDPEVKQYMDNALSGERNLLDSYVRRSASAGIKRSGFGVAGGIPLDTALHKQAMETLAGGYSGRLRDALNYTRQLKADRYQEYRDRQADSRYTAQMNLALRQTPTTPAAPKSNPVSDAYTAAQTKLLDQQLADMRRKDDMETYKFQMDKETQAREALNLPKFEQLAAKSGLATKIGARDAGWTGQDDLLQNYLGVKLGFLKPVNRSVSTSMKR
jgi:hypothetical protein